MARRKFGALKTLRIYRALRRKGVAADKARAIAGASRTSTRRSAMALKGQRTRRLKRI